MELRRQTLLQELRLLKFYVSRDGRLLTQLSLQELETERYRLPEEKELKEDFND